MSKVIIKNCLLYTSNAKNYIISFICEYTGKQGYYDYYKLNNEWESVFKMRYRGKITHFKFIS